MFSITCRTCAAKLKVKNPAAIGQRLACPKCGEMVEVQPPAGWTPPAGWKPTAEADQSFSAPADQSFAGGDFEDIDQIIGGKSPVSAVGSAASRPKAAAPAAAPSAGGPPAKAPPTSGLGKPNREPDPRGQAKSEPGKPLRERPPGELPAASTPPVSIPEKPLLQPRSDKFDLTQPREYLPDPSLPPPDWSKTRGSNARTILVSGLLLAGFLGVVAAIVSLLNRSDSAGNGKAVAEGKPPVVQPPAQSDPPQGEAEAQPKKSNQDGATPGAPTETEKQSQGEESQGANSTGEKGAEPIGSGAAGEPLAGATESESSGERPMPTPTDPEPKLEQLAQEGASNSLPSREERPVSPLANDAGPINSLPGESAGEKPGVIDAAAGPTTLTDRLGKLTQLLAGPGTSLTELGDLAESERTDRLVGLPRYLISQPTPDPPVGDPWSLPVAEIVYRDVPFHLFISEFSLLSGVPLSVDALALAQRGFPIDSPISVELENTTTGEVLATVLQKLKLERVTLSGVEVILPLGSQVTGDYRFPLPKIKDPSPEKFQAMCDSLMKLVDPVSWSLETGKRKLVVEGEELVVANTSTAAAQIGEFLGKLEAATELMANPADAAAGERLRSRAVRAQVGLQKALQLEPTLDQPLEEFLQRVYRQTGVAISVDWAALSAAGWSNGSAVPGDFEAATVEQLLKELARSLSATWISIDERTFQLTTFQEASRRGMLEIYPLHGLAIEPQPLMDILNQTLSGQLRENRSVQFLYVPEINALVVSAPQPLQRQFEAIVNRLKQPKK